MLEGLYPNLLDKQQQLHLHPDAFENITLYEL